MKMWARPFTAHLPHYAHQKACDYVSSLRSSHARLCFARVLRAAPRHTRRLQSYSNLIIKATSHALGLSPRSGILPRLSQHPSQISLLACLHNSSSPYFSHGRHSVSS